VGDGWQGAGGWAAILLDSDSDSDSDGAARLVATSTGSGLRVRRDVLIQIDEYRSSPFLPANTRWRLVTKTDHMHRRALDDLDAFVQPHL
jgi:hypothetical protein